MTEIKMSPRKTPKTGILEVEGRIVGRNKQIIDPKQVETYAQLGCKDTEIGDLLNVNDDTLRFNFKEELRKGRANLKQSLRRKQLEVALDGNVTMLIFLGKNLLGQSDAPAASESSEVLPWSDE